MSLLQLTEKEFEAKVVKSKSPVLVDFYAEWCGPCRQAGPVIEELAEEYKGKVVVGKVDVDENQALAGQYGVMSIPTVVMFKEGKEVDRLTGFRGKAGYEEMIKRAL